MADVGGGVTGLPSTAASESSITVVPPKEAGGAVPFGGGEVCGRDLLLDGPDLCHGHALASLPQLGDLRPLAELHRLPSHLTEAFAAPGSSEQVAEPDG